MRYRRANAAGGTYFFTVVLAERRSALLVERVELLREAIAAARQRHPFNIVAMVVLPDHLHAVWRMPPDDADYPMRWSLIKAAFSHNNPRQEHIRASRMAKRERGIWQRRFWEHQIRDDVDLQTHVDYIHHNPVKHGYVGRVSDWPYSSIHRYVRSGWIGEDWGIQHEKNGEYGE